MVFIGIRFENNWTKPKVLIKTVKRMGYERHNWNINDNSNGITNLYIIQ